MQLGGLSNLNGNIRRPESGFLPICPSNLCFFAFYKSFVFGIPCELSKSAINHVFRKVPQVKRRTFFLVHLDGICAKYISEAYTWYVFPQIIARLEMSAI